MHWSVVLPRFSLHLLVHFSGFFFLFHWLFPMESYVSWNHLGFRAGKKQILSNLSGLTPSGKLMCLLGPSGSGKTTFLNLISGATRPTEGSISKPQKGRSFFLRQEIMLHPLQTTEETCFFYQRMLNRIPEPENITYLLRRLELWHHRKTMVRDLSGGQKKRLGLLCSFLAKSNVLLLDEPTSGLDSALALQIMRFILNYVYEHDVICICSIHQPRALIWKMFDRVLILEGGRQLFFGQRALALPSINPDTGLNDDVDRLLDLISADTPTSLVIESNEDLFLQKEFDSVALAPPLPTRIIYLLYRNLFLYGRSVQIICTKLLLIIFIGIIEACILGTGEVILERYFQDHTFQKLMRILGFIIVKVFNVSILPICTISLHFDNKGIYRSEMLNQLYDESSFFFILTLSESFVQVLTSIFYAWITFFPRTRNHLNFYFVYSVVMTLQTLVSNAMVQFVATAVNHREISLVAISGYISLSFLLLIGMNINYQNGFFGALQYFSVMKYPVSALLLALDDRSLPTVEKPYFDLIIEKLNIDSTTVFAMGTWGNILVMLGLYLGFILLAYVAIGCRLLQRK